MSDERPGRSVLASLRLDMDYKQRRAHGGLLALSQRLLNTTISDHAEDDHDALSQEFARALGLLTSLAAAQASVRAVELAETEARP